MARASSIFSEDLVANNNYKDVVPTMESAAGLFEGEWISRLPIETATGQAELFDDARMHWLTSQMPDFVGARVLELGPFEAGHAYTLLKAGAEEVLGIEANTIAFAKCLIAKEILQMDKARFMFGIFERFLHNTEQHFDLIVASGVLYHLTDPLPTLLSILKHCNNIFIWSHFFDEQAMPVGDKRRDAFTGETIDRSVDGHTMKYHLRSYGDGVRPRTFCGGIYNRSVWVELGETIALLQKCGFHVKVGAQYPMHDNGPSSSLFARRA